MTETITEFYNYTLTNGLPFEIPINENIISIYVQNSGGFATFIVINGTNLGNGLILYPGNSLRVYGKYNQIFNGKISVLPLGLSTAQQRSVAILIRRKIN